MLTKADVQRLRSLREKKHREATGLFVVEGAKVVAELLAAGFPFLELYATPDWRPGNAGVPPAIRTQSDTPPNESPQAVASPRPSISTPAPAATSSPAPLVHVTAAEMARISHFPTPSPVLAVGKISRPPLEPDQLRHGLTLALEGVQDAGNVGTLLRIADWFAFDRVVLSPDCADLFHQKVINASMGSFARVKAHAGELAPLLAQLAGRDAPPILGCVLDGEDVHALPPLRDAVVVIGSEGRGLSPAVESHLTRRVTIPRHGHAESLNAAVAAGIICDHVRRTRL